MADDLSTRSNSGTQDAGNNTLTQPAGLAPSGGTPTDSVQPVIGGGALTSAGGVPLQPRGLPAVNLQTAQGSGSVAQPLDQGRDINPALFGVSGLLLAVAIVLFWSTTRDKQPVAARATATKTSSKSATATRPKKNRKKRNVKKKK